MTHPGLRDVHTHQFGKQVFNKRNFTAAAQINNLTTLSDDRMISTVVWEPLWQRNRRLTYIRHKKLSNPPLAGRSSKFGKFGKKRNRRHVAAKQIGENQVWQMKQMFGKNLAHITKAKQVCN